MARDNKIEIEILLKAAAAAKDLKDFSDKARDGLKDIKLQGTEASRATEGLTQKFSELKTVVMQVAAAIGVYKGLRMAEDFLKDVTLLAARYDELGLAVNAVGKNAGYSSWEMASLEMSLEKLGISGIAARESLTKMAAADIDLTRATKLAVAAQDLAVVGAMRTEEAFQTLVYGIQTGQERMLRTIGLSVDFTAGEKKLAEQLGKTTDRLTQHEIIQSRVNVVLRAAIRYQGTYKDALASGATSARELKDRIEDYKTAFGEAFQPAYVEIVKTLTGRYEGLKQSISAPEAQRGLQDMGKAVADVFSAILGQVEKLKKGGKLGDVFDTMAKDTQASLKAIAYTGAFLADSFRGFEMIVLSTVEELQVLWAILNRISAWAVEHSGIIGKAMGWSSEDVARWKRNADDLENKAAAINERLSKLVTQPPAIKSAEDMFAELDKVWAATNKERQLLNQVAADLRKGGDELGASYEGLFTDPMWKAPEKAAADTSKQLIYVLDGVKKVMKASDDESVKFTQLRDTSTETTDQFKNQTEEIAKLNAQLAQALRQIKQIKSAQSSMPSKTTYTTLSTAPESTSEKYGGILGFQGGGIAPGYSANDKYLAAFRGGEAFLSPESVDYYGKDFIRGLINRTITKEAAAGGPQGYIVVDFRLGQKSYPITAKKEKVLDALLKGLQNAELTQG